MLESPPLTPTDSQARIGTSLKPELPADTKISINPTTMTPEISPPQGTGRPEHEDPDAITPVPPSPVTESPRDPSAPSGKISAPSTWDSTASNEAARQTVPHDRFSVGPPASSGTATPRRNFTGSSTSFAKPATPIGDRDDPYARSKRTSPPKNKEDIDPRFVFSGRSKHQHGRSFANLSVMGLSRNNSNTSEAKPHSEKRHSGIFKRDNPPPSPRAHDENTPTGGSSKHGSMSDLKRFFRLTHRSKGSYSPSNMANKSGSQTPPVKPSQTPAAQPPQTQSMTPFSEENGLITKYGKLGKVLGSGAGGSVRLMRRSLDGVTFAVKEFRPRHAHETEKEYGKKVTAEFCIGSALHHGNVIETLDIVHEKGRYYEVMEYAPYDLFAMVTQGRMSREEATCSFLQIFAGVTYLHSVGLAHRDLKLDNVVVNKQGIMKIIDFGSATVFRYPFETDIVLAEGMFSTLPLLGCSFNDFFAGIVGSDPYMAPEVYENKKYDPQAVDIWSLAIIYCCMMLRRFPWKVPRLSDNSFKLFVSPPDDPGDPYKESVAEHRKSTPDVDSSNRREGPIPQPGPASGPTESSAATSAAEQSSRHHHHHHRHHDDDARDQSKSPSEGTTSTANPPPNPPSTTIKGPWRVLRLLPRESRHIMGRMLQVSPKNRATLQEMLDDPWIANSPVCRQEENGEVVSAPGHTHTLMPGAAVQPEPAKQQKGGEQKGGV